MSGYIRKFSGNKVARLVGVRHRAITLTGVPHWVTAGDVRRTVERYGATGIMDVCLQHESGLPTGRAFIEFDTGHNAHKATNLLTHATLTTIPITVRGFTPAALANFQNMKKLDSEQTDVEPPATAIIFGIPAHYSVLKVREFLQDYHLPYFGNARESIVRLERAGSSSRWAIHLKSPSDAHRLARNLHLKRFTFGTRSECQLWARVSPVGRTRETTEPAVDP